MELVYLYIEKAYGEIYNMEINFSLNTEIKFHPKSKKIVKKEITSSVPNDFFGENIINVSGIVGKNGVGKSTIISFLSFSSETADQNMNRYFIIYKDHNNDYYVEGNINNILKNEVYKRYFDKVIINNGCNKVIDNTHLSDIEDGKKLKFIRVNTKKKCGSNNMFSRLWSSSPDKHAIFEFLSSDKFSDAFKISRKNTIKINFNNYDYKTNFFIKNDDEDFLNYVKSISDEAFNILDEDLSNNIFAIQKVTINSNGKKEKYKNNKTKFIDLLYKVIYKNIIYFIFHWLYGDKDDFKIDPRLALNYKKRVELVKRFLPKSAMGESSNNNIRSILNDEISEQINNSLGVNYKFSNIYIDITRLIKLAGAVKDDFFMKDNSISIDINSKSISDKDIQSISGFLECLVKLESSIYEISSLTLSEFSSGEEYIIKTFAQIYNKIENKENSMYVLLLDEYELHLHPEWARKFLHYLLNFLEGYNKTKFQLVMTSHSPYLISDLPKECIRLIKLNHNSERIISTPKSSFANNYYDILKDNFFLDDTIGEFAKKKIEDCITELNKINDELTIDDKNKDNVFLLNKIEKTIKLIDDGFIRGKLESILNSIRYKVMIKNPIEIENELYSLEKKRAYLLSLLGGEDD